MTGRIVIGDRVRNERLRRLLQFTEGTVILKLTAWLRYTNSF